MLFAIVYTNRNNSTEATDKRTLDLFTNWKLPPGFEFKAHYAFADGSGGIGIAEASSAAALYEAHVPWVPFLDFKTIPIVEIGEAVAIQQRSNAWRDSVR